jgi:hypothetical protein
VVFPYESKTTTTVTQRSQGELRAELIGLGMWAPNAEEYVETTPADVIESCLRRWHYERKHQGDRIGVGLLAHYIRQREVLPVPELQPKPRRNDESAWNWIAAEIPEHPSLVVIRAAMQMAEARGDVDVEALRESLGTSPLLICDQCAGEGKFSERECPVCKGSGWEPE